MVFDLFFYFVTVKTIYCFHCTRVTLISMEEDTSLVWRKSKISMQEGREVQGKSVIRLIPMNIDYSYTSTESICVLSKIYFVPNLIDTWRRVVASCQIGHVLGMFRIFDDCVTA